MNRRRFLMAAAGLPLLNRSFGAARVRVEGDRLIATTGALERQWRFTESGLATCSLRDVARGREWIAGAKDQECDWQVPGLTEGPAKIESIDARESDDEGFTSPHLEVVVSLLYPRPRVAAQYVIWLYAGAEGIRTQLRFRALEGFTPAGDGEGTVERYALDIARLRRRAVSYSKHNSARADRYEQNPMMRERLNEGAPQGREVHEFTSLVALEDRHGSLAVIKESPVVDSPVRGTSWQKPGFCAYRLGAFVCDARGVEVTGAGIAAGDVTASEWRPGWATWTVLGGAGEAELQRAIKMFDRVRFPLDPDMDLYIGANNWGSTDNPKDGKQSSAEPSILREIEAAAEMGIEVVQIDDGWQQRADWTCDPQVYPQGWTRVKRRAAEEGVRLGLWCDGDAIPLPTLLNHVDAGGFRYVKFDFYDMSTYAKVADMRRRARTLLEHCGRRMRINWDTTGTNSKDRFRTSRRRIRRRAMPANTARAMPRPSR